MNKKIRVLYTIPNFDTAGSGKVLYDLAKGLDKEKFEVIIACSNDKGDFFEEVKSLGFPIFIRPITEPLRPYLSLLFRLRENIKFIRNNKINIVHSWHWSSDWSEVLAARLGGAKFIYTKKAMTWGNIHWKIKSYLSTYIITTNEQMTNYFPYKKNQSLIPFGIATDYFNPTLFHVTKQEDVFKICVIANLVPVKRIELIIKAIQLLNMSTIYLDIIGSNSNEYGIELKKTINNLEIDRHVRFLGKQNDIRLFLVNSDLFIISSEKEGMPLALIEAIGMGIPVLGSNITGVNLVLKNFPELLFESGNEFQLAKKIKEMVSKSKEERQEIGKKLRQYCIDNHSMNNFLKSHEEIYLKLL